MTTTLLACDLDLLNQRFGAAGRIVFRAGPNGLPVVALAAPHGACEVSLYGGQVLSYRPVGHAPVLFLSRSSAFEPGKPIRGGIPVCWPWFGPHASDPARPLHGFARTSEWRVDRTEYGAEATELRLCLVPGPETAAWFPHAFELRLDVRIDQRLTVELTTRNLGDQPLDFAACLHAYFSVREIDAVAVDGLDGLGYVDRLTGIGHVQQGPVAITAETDRLYAQGDDGTTCGLRDDGARRVIEVEADDKRALVIWNPWIDKAARMVDFGDDEYTRMICLEPANTDGDEVTLEPGARHTLSMAVQAALP